MKTTRTRFAVILLAVVMIVACAQPITAATTYTPYGGGGEEAIKMPKNYIATSNYSVFFKFKKKVTSVKSSKGSVGKISKYSSKIVVVNPKKSGTTKLTVKAGGKKYTCKFTYVKYKNPFKSLVVFGEDITSNYNSEYSASEVFCDNGAKGVVSVKLKSGYSKLKIKMNGKAYTNNTTFTALANNNYDFTISVYNKLSKKTEKYTFTLEAF